MKEKKVSSTILAVLLIFFSVFSSIPIAAFAASGPDTIDLTGFDFTTDSSDTNWSYDQGTAKFTIYDTVTVVGGASRGSIAFELNGHELDWEADFSGTLTPTFAINGNGTFNFNSGSITKTSSFGAAIGIPGNASLIINDGVINAGDGGVAISGADPTHTPNNVVISGDAVINGEIDDIAMVIDSGATLTTNNLTLTSNVLSSSSITNNGTINNTGTLTNNGMLTNNGTVNNPVGSTILNNAEIINSSGGVINNAGTITNNDTVNNIGTLINSGTVNNSDTIDNSGTIVDNGGTYTGPAPTGNTPLTGITFSTVQTGGTSGTADSTGINLTFNQSVTGLTASDITIAIGTGAAVKGTLSGSGTSWNIGLSSVTTEGNVSVSIDDFNGFRVTNSPQTAAVYKDQTIAPTITTTTLPNGTLGTAYSQILAATGTTPITWTVDSGSLPGGLTLAGATGEISGTPTASGTFSFTVKAANGTAPDDTKALTITIIVPTTSPTITTTTLPDGTVGTAYSQILAATGTTPITWTIDSGSLPGGLTLAGATGEISGTPTASGIFSFTVKAANGTAPDDTMSLSISIIVPTIAPTITTTTLPDGTVGTAYSQTLAATGTTPITWTIDSGSLPGGLTLAGATGEISGTPTASGTFSFTVKAANGTAPDDTKALTITISASSGSSSGGGGGSVASNPRGSFNSDGNAYTKEASTGIVFTVNKDFYLFSNVRVNGVTLTKDSDYSAENGSTIITLFPSYLDTLQSGTHTLTVEFRDNTAASAQFTVAKAPDTDTDTDTLPPPIDAGVLFDDIRISDWFAADVVYVYESGLMKGTNSLPLLFSPNAILTRSMIATILYRHSESPDVSGLANPFDDVAAGQWYTDAIIWAVDIGIVHGYGGNVFGTNDPITRQDLAVILMRYMNFLEINLPVNAQWIIFADETDISSYAVDAIQTLNKLGIINGNDTNASGQVIIDPKGNATRAQVAAMLHRFMETIDR